MTNPRIPYRLSTSHPRLAPPQGKPIIVHVVVNVEHWRFDASMPRTLITPPHGKETVPDVPNFSWADYGMRAGLPRFLRALGERGLPASTSINASVIDAYPEAAEAILKAGWEFIGHGMHQASINAATDERATLDAALDRIARFTGKRPRGWLSPGLRESHDTPDHLKSLGVEYLCDWVVEDIPVWMHTKHGPLIAMPYSIEINDGPVHSIDRYGSDELYKRLVHTLECFEREARSQARVLAIGLHPHLMGVPHRIVHLERMLDLLMARADTVFMRGAEIADWFAGESPPR